MMYGYGRECRDSVGSLEWEAFAIGVRTRGICTYLDLHHCKLAFTAELLGQWWFVLDVDEGAGGAAF
jgi:hypothetical protein